MKAKFALGKRVVATQGVVDLMDDDHQFGEFVSTSLKKHTKEKGGVGMGLSRLTKNCKECPFVDKCKNKRMEALAYIGEPEQMIADTGQSASMSAAAPLLRETMEIHVGGKTLTVYKDDIEKELYKHLGVGLMQCGG